MLLLGKMLPWFPTLSALWVCGASLPGTAACGWLSGCTSRLYVSVVVSREACVFAPGEEGAGEPGCVICCLMRQLMRGAGRAGVLSGRWGHLGCVPPASQLHCLCVLKPGMTPLRLHRPLRQRIQEWSGTSERRPWWTRPAAHQRPFTVLAC